jgi:hypothetical protein
MTLVRNIHWPRIIAEGTVIVVSILLAFWIDAWWQGQVEKKESDRTASWFGLKFTNPGRTTTYLQGRQLRILNSYSPSPSS